MRETLHQLALALALPITVGAFWIARGERSEPMVRERATAYRAELAQLPLPTRERLRSPGLPTAAAAARPTPEEQAAPRERRLALSEPAETGAAPLGFAARESSAPAVAAAPSPRPSLETLDAAPRNALGVTAPVSMAAPTFSSPRADASATGIAVAEPAPSAAAEPAAKPSPPARATAVAAEPNLFRRERLLALQDAPLVAAAARDPRGVAQEETTVAAGFRDPHPLESRAGTPVASLVRSLGLGRLLPVAHERGRSEPTPSPKLVDKNGREPLLPIQKLVDLAQDFSWSPGSGPSVLPDALPPLEAAGDQSEPVVEVAIEPSPFLNWSLKPYFPLIIPEPASATLLGAALAALGALRRSRQRG